jgi:hypothetical protein
MRRCFALRLPGAAPYCVAVFKRQRGAGSSYGPHEDASLCRFRAPCQRCRRSAAGSPFHACSRSVSLLRGLAGTHPGPAPGPARTHAPCRLSTAPGTPRNPATGAGQYDSERERTGVSPESSWPGPGLGLGETCPTRPHRVDSESDGESPLPSSHDDSARDAEDASQPRADPAPRPRRRPSGRWRDRPTDCSAGARRRPSPRAPRPAPTHTQRSGGGSDRCDAVSAPHAAAPARRLPPAEARADSRAALTPHAAAPSVPHRRRPRR